MPAERMPQEEPSLEDLLSQTEDKLNNLGEKTKSVLKNKNAQLNKANKDLARGARLQNAFVKKLKVERKLRRGAEKKATIDHLTGLWNRHGVEQKLKEIYPRFKRYEREHEIKASLGEVLPPIRLALIIVDIDHFKEVNDTYGHQGGDLVLQQIGIFLKNKLRAGEDIVCRIGGEEFLIIAEVKGDSDIEGIINKLRLDLAQTPLHIDQEEGGETITKEASFGIYIVDDIEDIEHAPKEIIHKADVALYGAKTRGRNQSQFYTPELEASWHEEQQRKRAEREKKNKEAKHHK